MRADDHRGEYYRASGRPQQASAGTGIKSYTAEHPTLFTPTQSSPAACWSRRTPPGSRPSDDARGGLAQELHVELVEVRGHAVGRGHGAQAHDEVIGAAV